MYTDFAEPPANLPPKLKEGRPPVRLGPPPAAEASCEEVRVEEECMVMYIYLQI